jgi:CubicO group peptidase (beta-lactamase class C family)
MRISKFFLAIATLMVLMSATLPSKEERTSQAIQKVMDEFQAVGISAAIVKDGKIVYNESFGYKNLEEKTPLTNNDVMRIASI